MKRIYFLVMMVFAGGVSWAQQVIGLYPNMNGGLGGITAGSLTVVSTLSPGTQYTEWILNNTGSAASSVIATGGRSGPEYVTYSSTSSSTRRISSPTVQPASASGFAASTAYTIQYFYRTTGVANFGTAINIDGTANWGTTETTGTLASTSGAWTKRTVALTTNAGTAPMGISPTSTRYGHIQFRSNASMGAGASIDIDDIVVYPGAVDNTAPNSPGAVTVNNPTGTSLDVGWTAASGGEDGGGYVVVRFNSDPAAADDPQQNGIYAIANTIAGTVNGTVVYIGTGLGFTDNGLAGSSTYYYKVYTVDKAFNYSGETTGNGLTLATVPVRFGNVKAYQQGSGIKIDWSNYTETDVVNYQVERSADGISFTSLITANPSLNTSGRADYSHIDAAPFNGVNFYRIRSLETSGKILYSAVVRVDIKGNGSGIGIYPNPITDNQFSLQTTGLPKGKYSLNVIAANGQKVYSRMLQLTDGAATEVIQLPASVKPGYYSLQVSDGVMTRTKTVILQ